MISDMGQAKYQDIREREEADAKFQRIAEMKGWY